MVLRTVKGSYWVKFLLEEPCPNDCRTYWQNVLELVAVCGLKKFLQTLVYLSFLLLLTVQLDSMNVWLTFYEVLGVLRFKVKSSGYF